MQIVVEYFGESKLTRNLGKFKPLLIFIACICLFVSASCIYASEDVDGTVFNNQSSADINGGNDDEDVLSDIEIDVDNSANSGNQNPHHETDYKKHANGKFGHDAKHHKKPANGIYGDKAKHNKKHITGPNGKKAKYYHKFAHEKHPADSQPAGFSGNIPDDINQKESSTNSTCIKDQAKYKISEKAYADNSKRIQISDNIFKNQLSFNYTNSFKSAVIPDSKLCKGEFYCCKESKCNHNLNTDIHDNHKVIIEGDFNDNLAYSYNCGTLINNSMATVISLRDCDEEEFINQKNRNLKNVLTINKELSQITDESSLKDCNSDLDMVAGDLTVNYTDCEFNPNGLEINLNSDKLDVKDYNLEYYIFTNPYIIAESINVENVSFNNNIQNHRFNANQTIAPTTMNQNNSIINIETIFNQESLFGNCTGNGNYEKLDNTTFCNGITSAIEIDAFKLLKNDFTIFIGQDFSHKLSNENTILILGELNRCLI